MARPRVILGTALFFLGWITATLLYGIACTPAMLSRRAVWRVASLWSTCTLAWLRVTCGIRSHVEGLEHLQPGTLIAPKHQSAWDTIMLWRTLKNPVFVLKRELYMIPVFGWYLWRCGNIAIDRSAPREAMEIITRETARYAAQGRSIVMFPEGTRVPPGERLPFKAGIARVSAHLAMPVTPAALNTGHYWPKRSLWKTPGTAVLRFMPPVPPCGGDQKAWLKELEARINAESDAIARREGK